MLSRARHCGLDFGTSNSTIATAPQERPGLLALEGEHPTIPSAVFYGFDADHAFLVGRAGIQAYVEGVEGRLLRALKSILGSALVREKTPIHRRRVAFSEIIQQYVGELKRRAEAHAGGPLDHVVMGRPVHFVNDDPDGDRQAEADLADIARAVGFREVSFQFEPVAAARDYEQQITGEQLVLIADIGGGTSDFSVLRLSSARQGAADRKADILANGGVRIGGTDFDRLFSMAVFMPALGHGTRQIRDVLELPAGPYWDLSTWSGVHLLYEPKRINEIRSIRRTARQPETVDRLLRVIEQRRAHSMLMQVEDAKIALSDADHHESDLGWIEPGLSVTATRDAFLTATERLRERLTATALDCVKAAGVAPGAVDALYFTGGTSQIPSVRAAIAGPFPEARMIDGDRFGSVGLGLAIEARRRYG